MDPIVTHWVVVNLRVFKLMGVLATYFTNFKWHGKGLMPSLSSCGTPYFYKYNFGCSAII
jgi:hypothetical protein